MRFQALQQHKSLAVNAIIALAIFLFGFFLVHDREVAYHSEQALVKSTQSSDIDTDHDGLPDWKERLYRADINDPDTDKDGTSDGDEVRAGRNPVIPNKAENGKRPTDEFSYLRNDNAASSTDALERKKEFFARYLAEESRNIKETAFHDLIKKVDTQVLKPRTEIIDLNISSNNNPSGVRTYVNAFGVLIQKYTSQHMERGEDAVIQDTITKKDQNTTIELQLFAVMYKNFAKDLIALSVPSSLAQTHLLIINGYEGMSAGLLGLEKMQSDPVNGTASYDAYLKYRLDVTKGYALIVTNVIKQHLIFTPDEPGYPFYWNTATTKVQTAK